MIVRLNLVQNNKLKEAARAESDPDKMEQYEAKDKKWQEECAPIMYPKSEADRIRVDNQMRECQESGRLKGIR